MSLRVDDVRQLLKNSSPDVQRINAALDEDNTAVAPPKANDHGIQELTFLVPMEITGKARPRLGGNKGGKRAFMAEEYRTWCRKFEGFVPVAFWDMPALPVFLEIIVIRKLPINTPKRDYDMLYGSVCMAGADRDNAIGAVMDVLWHKKDGRIDNVVVTANCTAVWGDSHQIVVSVKLVDQHHKPFAVNVLRQYDPK